jgi:putative nucleotidyltransferase with HDIG domain
MTANEMIAQVKDLPLVTPAALRLLSLLDDTGASNTDIIQLLKHDSVLTAKILRACNSPIFGFEDSVSSIDQAVLILGHQQVLQLVLSLSFGASMLVPMPGYALEAQELWRHALTTGSAAELIVSCGFGFGAEASVAFTAGLLHDFGKPVTAPFLTPEKQAAIRRLVEQERRSRVDAEAEVLGADHCATGAGLLQRWRLPDTIIEAVAHHHHPVLEPRPQLSAVVHVANCMAHLAGSAPGCEAYALRAEDEVASALQISAETVQSLVISVQEASVKMERFMRVS